MKTYNSQGGGPRLGLRLRKGIAAFASLTLSMTTMVVGAIDPTPATAAPGDGICYLIADSGGGNGGNDLLTIVDRGDFNPATNETNIGTGTGTYNIEAMDMNPATLELYAANANRLGRIDKLTGVFTPLSNTFGNADGALGTIAITDVDGLAFDYITGELWGAERQSTNDLLVKIDIATGLIIQDAFGPGVDYVETNISNFGHDDLDDIAFHPFTGVLYGSITGGGGPGRLVTLDTATGNATDVGAFGAGDMEGMRFDAEGFLWATSGTTPGELFEINITTGAATNPRTVDNGGDYESTVCYVPGSDLWLDKTVSDSTPFEGGTTTYTIEVFNAGPANATGVVVEDVLPAGVTFVAASGPGSYDETTGVWNAGAILRNESALLSITVAINAGTAGTTITNTATRTAVDQGDAVPNNDTASVDINPVVGITGLELVKSSNAGGPVEPGQTITYTLDITNTGTNLLQGINVTDAVPAGTTYVPGSTSVTGFLGGDYRDEFNSQSYSNNDGSAFFSTNWTEFGEGTNPTGGDIRIITDTGTSPDQDPYQLRIKDDDRGVQRSANLSSVGGATVSLDFRRQSLDSTDDYVVLEVASSPGGTYRELASFEGPGTDPVYTNTGPLALNAGELTSTTTFRLSTSGSLGNGDIVWVDNFTVQAAEPVTDATGNAPESLVISDDGYVLPPGETMQVTFDVIADTILSQSMIDNSAIVAASGALPATDSVSDPVATADVAVDKTVDNAAPNPGETINYTITVTNNGPSAARLIEVTDLLPAGVTYVSDDSGGDYNDSTGVWSAGTLPPSGSTSIVITATVDAGTEGTSITNTATITQTDRPDPDPTNDTDDADIDVPVVDLAVTKIVDDATPVVGDTVVFTITITNNGPDTATGVSLDDTLPGGITYVSDTASTGSYSGGVWTIGTMASGATETLTLTGTVDAGTYGTTITNTAAVASVTETDSDPSNDDDSTSVDVQHNPVIQVVKNGPATAEIGEIVTYTFTITHTAASDGSPVTIGTVTDDVAGAASFDSGDTNGNSLLDGGESWIYSATHVVTASDPDPILNTVTVTASDEDGDDLPESTDDHSTDIDHLPVIVVDKIGPAVAVAGDTVAYSFTVSHDPTSDGTPVSNLTVSDDVAGAAAYVSGDDGDGLLEAGETWTFEATYTIQATDPDPLVNTGTATGDDEDGDPVTDDDTHTTDLIDPAIQIEKTPDSQTIVTGTAATFTITVTNTGDADLTDVEVTDAFAPACDNLIGDLAASASTSFTCSLVNVTADFTNTASVEGTHAAGGTVTDSDDADVIVIDPAIQIEKTPDAQTIVTGTAATFTITVTNTGDADLTDVEVTDALAPACDTVIGDLAASASTSYTCSVSNVTADFTNVASVEGSHAAGGTVTDSDDADVTVIDPDISITKSPNEQTILTGGTANFTITVVNTGDSMLTNVLVADALAPACGGPIVDLAPGDSTSYACSLSNVTADFTNIASVEGSHAAGGTVTDSDDADVIVIDPAIEITKSPDNQQVLAGDTATFTIVVTNTGDADLTSVTVTDPAAPACDNGIGDLAAGASTTYTCSLANVTADFVNTASVVGTHAAAGTVTDSDTANIDVIGPAITIEKTPDSQRVRPGDTVTFDIRVENTGDVTLTDVTVTDVVAPNCDATFASMAPGAVETYSCSMTAGADDFTNTASVTADDPLNNPVSDSDDAAVDVINPAVSITKDPASQQVRSGDTVTFTITVENTGDVDLTNVAVSDPTAPACDSTIGALASGASTSYDCTMTAGADDFTNTASVTGDDPNGDPVVDTDDAVVDVINPAITIDKTPDSQQVRPGDTVTFTIVITNTGDVDLTGVAVSDAVAPDCDNVIGNLAVGEIASYDCTMTAGAVDFTNVADVTGDDPNGDPVTDQDTAVVDVINPAIDIEKTPDTQQARSGDTVTFTITVENTGDVTLTNVTVSDAVAPSCGATFASMAPGAIESYDCTMTAGAADFTNVADVTGDDPNGDPVTDQDTAAVDVINPAIDIEKSPDTQFALFGSTVTFTITVENTGDVDLTDVAVVDAVAPACDNVIGDLAVGEIASYDCTMTAGAVDFTNTADVTGDDPNSDPVTDQDTAVVDVINPAITIDKSPDNQQVLANGTATFDITVTNTGDVDLTDVSVSDLAAPGCDNVIGDLAAGDSTTYTCSLANVTADFTNIASVVGTHDAGGTVSASDTADVDVIGPAINIEKTPDLQQVREGDTVTFTITVENTGDVTLTDVTVNDAVAPSCDATLASMAPGAVETYTCTMAAGADDYTNTANVTGDDPLNNTVTDSDTADVDVIAPAITITKDPATQQARDGDTVTFTITVENTGDVDLTGVTVTDAVAPACDNVIGGLAVGGAVSYDCSMTAGAVDFTNTASVTGNDPNGDPVTDDDSAAVDVINPAIDIQKTPDSQQVRTGDTVTFDIRVENIGDVTLTDVAISDAVAPNCDATFASMVPGAVQTYSCTMTALADDYTNVASVTGDDPLDNPVTDSDGADVDVINPAIDVEKTPDTQQARPGDTVTFTITVANSGDVDLTGVTVTDAVAPACDNTIGALVAGAFTSYDCTMTALADDFTNTADVTGDDPNGDPVADSDDADVDVINPSITIDKTPDTQSALPGGTVTFDITVANTGDVDLTGVTVTDVVAPACGNVIGALAVGESSSYQCTMTAGASDFTNVADVTGNDPNGDPVTDSDDADVVVVNPAITIDKTPDYQQVLANGTATFDITVTNPGDVDLTDVTVTDPAAPACDNVIGNLAAGASTTYTCSLANVPNDFTNVASVVGTHAAGGTVSASDTADVDVIGPAIDIEKTPDTQQAREGDTVTFTIRVENTGDVTLTDVTVTDAVAPSCDATFASMAPGAVEAYTCSMTAGDADFTNTADVTGDDPLNNPVTDTDSADVDVIVPAISITKDPATQMAHDGDTVTFTITVANTGDVDLAAVTVTDAVAPSCDASIGDLASGASTSYDCSMAAGAVDFTNVANVTGNDPLGGPVTDSDSADVDIINPSIQIEKGPDSQQAIAGGTVTFDITVTNPGDVDLTGVIVTDAAVPACDNVIGSLAAGASTTYSCTTTVGGGDFTNTASVTGDDPLGTPVNDSDTADVDVVNPVIDIAKNPNSQTLLGGETATFTITVTNIGDVPLTNVVVTDPLAPSCNATYPSLAVGASDTYTCTLTNVTADFTNVAVVAGEHPASPDPITDSDVADVEVIAPEIDIQKTPDTQTVTTGSDVTFTITVENTGDVDLTNIVVTDALAPACDATFASLVMGEIQTYDCTVTGVTAGFTNTADVNAEEPSGGTVSDSDTADVTVIDPSISIDKSPDNQTILPNGDATFTITVTNTGDVDLTNVAVSDPLAPNCDATYGSLAAGASESYTCSLSNVAAGFTNVATVTAEDPLGNPVEDTDTADVVIEAPAIEITKTADTPTVVSGGDAIFAITVTNTGTTPLTGVAVTDPLAASCEATIGDLAVGGSTTYNCTVTGVTADFTNTASVVGTHPLGGTVTDDDSADVDVIAPAISITKDPAAQQVLAGQDATFTITVTNTGDVDLTGVAVTDALAPVCDNTIGDLAVDEVVSYTCDVTAVSDFTNTAAVSGLDPLGNTVIDADDAVVDVISPEIQIEKTPDLQYAVTGSDVTFTITVTNTGDVDLTGVAVVDALAPVCDSTIGGLAAAASTSYDCTVSGVTADFTNNAAVSGLDPLGNTVSDDDDAVVDVIDPSISLAKDPATQQILSGQDANFTITVTNTGDSPLTNVTITDAMAPACDAVIPALGAGASTTVNCTAPAVTSSFTNTASVVATHAGGGTVNDSDTADVEVLIPEVDIQKTPDLQIAGVGDTVTFDITVTNAGVVPLSNVIVTDALAPNCDATIGDLAVGGSNTYSCTLTVSADLTNTAVVDATDAAGNPATDSDTADVDVVAPAITIEKTPDNQSVVLNDTPTFTITVTNTGDIDLTNVVITDALAPACDATFASLAVGANETYTCDGTATAADFTNTADVAADSVVGPVSDSDTADVTVLVPAIDIQKTPDNQLVGPAGTATFTITVTNAGATPLTDVTVSDPLAPNCDATFASMPVGAVEIYTCDVSGVSGDFTNTADVTGDDPLGNPVTDSDTADVDFVDPAITIEKTPDLQTLLAGEDASFTITVTNSGDTDLTNVVITDPRATGCEAIFATLAMGASETVTCDVTAVAVDFTNVASVTADTPLGTQVSDSDDALVDVVAPGVQIEKTPDTQQIHSGDGVTFTITVTNNGDQDLVDLTVTDALTPACDTAIAALAVGESTSYDCTATGVTDDFTNIAAVNGTDALGNPVSDSDDAAVDVINPAIDIQKTPDNQAVVINGTATFDITVTNNGDVDLTGVTVSDPAAPACDNVIGDLAVGDSATYSCSLSGVAGDFTNTAAVTGNDPLDAPVTDSDTADVTVLVPAIDIQKTPDLQQARAGDTVDFTITVSNAGATSLTNVTVTDVMAPACDTVIGDLSVGESATFTCSMTAGAADFTNTADVTGDDPIGNPVTDSDTADVDIIGPSISIEKSPDGQTVVTGGTATFTIEVTNTGDVDLFGVAVSDAAVPACDATIGALAVGESTSYTCSVSDLTADFTNTADVTGTDPIGETVTDSDTADVTLLVPGIDIQKTPDTQTVVEGDDATFTIIVTNTGQTDLFNVTVSDPLAPACDNVIGDLPVGSASVTYTCTAAAAASFTNTATVDAVDPLDNPVTDNDTADVVALVRSNINGTIAHDIAGDGAIDGSDTGLGGVDVSATWAGLDGVFGTADDEVYTTTTDGNGDYSFDLVPPGEYRIDVGTADLPFGVDFQTLDPDATLDSSTMLTLPEDTTYPDVDFAYTATGSIGDLVWLDLDNDGVQDPGEPGLGGIGVSVTWLGPDGVPGGGDDLAFTTTTAPDGSYLVDGLPAGEFTVVIDGIPAGLSGDLDQTVTLGAAEARDDVDFPLVGTGSIGDQVFEDLDHDGAFDSGEPGVPNVTVNVTWAGPDGVIGTSDDVGFTTVTDGNGQYLVGGLPAGEYFVEIDETTIPADLGTAPPVTVSLPGGGSDLTADFPLVGNRPPVAIDDEDVTDEDTPVVITVLDDDSDPDGHSFAISTTTDPGNGSIVVNADGTITYTPNPGFVGVDTFTYTICELDGVVNGIPATGLCDTATVTVTIVEVNDPPGPEASFQSVVVGDPLGPMPVFDPDGGPVTVTYISGELPPGITMNPDGTFNGFTEEIGTYQVIVEVCDDDDPQICIIHTHTIAVTPLTLPGPGDDPDPEDPPDTLPFTGANFGDLLMAALMMLTAGGAMVLYSRRRRALQAPASSMGSNSGYES